MHRIFYKQLQPNDRVIDFKDKDEIHHIRDVLRLAQGDHVIILNGEGLEAVAEIAIIAKKNMQFNILEMTTHAKNERMRIVVACAVPKHKKVDFIIEKLTEIGVQKIILLKTERVAADLRHIVKRMDRLEKISHAALKQCGSFFAPTIESMDFKSLLSIRKEFDIALIPNLEEKARTSHIAEVLKNNCSARTVLIVIGPEGDFSPRELRSAATKEFISVQLGDNVLRVETAAIVVAGFVQLFFTNKQ